MMKEKLEVTLMLDVSEEDISKYLEAYHDGRLEEFIKFGFRFNFDHLKITEALLAATILGKPQEVVGYNNEKDNNVSQYAGEQKETKFIEPVGVIKPTITSNGNNAKNIADKDTVVEKSSMPTQKPKGKGILGRKRIKRQ